MPPDPLRLWSKRGSILAKLGRFNDAITELNSALDAKGIRFFDSGRSRALCYLELGKIHCLNGQVTEAEVEFRKAFELDDTWDVSIELAQFLEKTGKTGEAESFWEFSLKSVPKMSRDWCRIANLVAWRRYLSASDLATAEQLAADSLRECDSLHTLQTLFAIQGRAGKWDAADVHFRRYVRECPMTDIVDRWEEDVLFFRDVVKSGRQQWAFDIITSEVPLPKDERWEIICSALKGEAVGEKRVQVAVGIVAAQFRSDDSGPKFPAIGKGEVLPS